MTLLSFLERLSELPSEVWLVPPVLIIVSICAIGLMLRRARLQRYRAIAARTGLSVKSSLVNVSQVFGNYAGRALVMMLASPQRTTLFRRKWTVVTVDLRNPEHIGLHMRPQDRIDTAIMIVGGNDVQVGDVEFDGRFVIYSRDQDVVATLFQDRALRTAILNARIDTVRLAGSKLHAYYPREERSPEHADLFFAAVVRLANGVDALQRPHAPEIIRP